MKTGPMFYSDAELRVFNALVDDAVDFKREHNLTIDQETAFRIAKDALEIARESVQKAMQRRFAALDGSRP